MQAGIRAVDAGRLTRDAFAGWPASTAPVWLIAAGKAAITMAGAAVDALGPRLQGGLVVSPGGLPGAPLAGVVGQHPQPGPGSEEGGRRALAIAEAIAPDAELVVLISGGASSLLAVPADGLTLDDKRAATAVLLRSGADIYALNTVRKHLSKIKGGRLAAACRARSHTFVLSDVVGDDLSVVASGPTVPDGSTFADALRVVDTFGGTDAYPPAVVEHLRAGARGERVESPKPGDARFGRASTTLIGGRHHAMHGAATHAASLGYDVVVLDEAVVGEARASGPTLARGVIERHAADPRPRCVIASGETTVRVTGQGLGGRNQELALGVATVLAGNPRVCWFASAGTDGIDGPTLAAGALVDSTTLARAAADGLPAPQTIFDTNNSYPYFDALGDLIMTGPSGTNVGDLHVFLLA